jgi:hypothetical protein
VWQNIAENLATIRAAGATLLDFVDLLMEEKKKLGYISLQTISSP